MLPSRLLFIQRFVPNLVVKLVVLVATLATAGMAMAASGVAMRSVEVQSEEGDALMTLDAGDSFQVLGSNRQWTQIQVGRKIGYVPKDSIQLKRVAVVPAVAKPNQVRTEAGCLECELAGRRGNQVAVNDFAGLTQKLNTVASANPNQCVADRLLSAAKMVNRKIYHGKTTTAASQCGVGVRTILYYAGITQKNVGIGDAKDMRPGLEKMGFVNLLKSNPRLTPDNAPAGSVLVYGAALKGARGCGRVGGGRTYGHVEIKENNGSFYYDAHVRHSIQAQYPKSCRPLIGVMQMGKDCPTCKKNLKLACGV